MISLRLLQQITCIFSKESPRSIDDEEQAIARSDIKKNCFKARTYILLPFTACDHTRKNTQTIALFLSLNLTRRLGAARAAQLRISSSQATTNLNALFWARIPRNNLLTINKLFERNAKLKLYTKNVLFILRVYLY